MTATPRTVTHTDAHLEPAEFRTKGTLAEVIDATLGAIAREEHTDVLLTIKAPNAPVMVEAGCQIGALQVTGRTTKGLGFKRALFYTRSALRQLVERTGSPKLAGRSSSSAANFVDVALWASPPVRSMMIFEMLTRGVPKLMREERTFRVAVDAHNADPLLRSRPYIRAIVSKQYSAESGDDLAQITALNDFCIKTGVARDFLEGKAWSHRDPAGTTGMVADSAKKLPNNARLTMRYQNNEIGTGAAHCGLSLTFEVEAQRPVENEFGEIVRTRRIEISIPGTSAATRATHHGGKVGGMFDGFAEKLATVLLWAPTAIEKLAKGPADEETRFAPIFKSETGTALRTLQHEVRAFTEQLVTQGVAKKGSALLCALVLSEFGRKLEAGVLVEEICGRV